MGKRRESGRKSRKARLKAGADARGKAKGRKAAKDTNRRAEAGKRERERETAAKGLRA